MFISIVILYKVTKKVWDHGYYSQLNKDGNRAHSNAGFILSAEIIRIYVLNKSGLTELKVKNASCRKRQILRLRIK